MNPFQIPGIDLPDYEALLAALVAQPSVSSPLPEWDQSNRSVIEQLEAWFTRIGFQTEILDVPGEPGKYNFIASLGQGGEGLVLAGHTDTVPYDSQKWMSDPFKLKYEAGKYFGLGTCDMKGFFPIIIEALRGLEGAILQQPLIVLATADEESSMSGARALAQSGRIQGRAAVIGEPTSLHPVHMHKGIMMGAIRVSGRSGHSSNPALGNNAMEAMHEVITELLSFRTKLHSRYENPAFEVTSPSLNLGHIKGGDSPNRICGHCELSFDLRPLPGMNTMSLYDEIKLLVDKVARRREIDIQVQPLIESVEPFAQAKDVRLVSLSEKITGNKAKTVAFATEAPFFQSQGLETIVMGAGSIDQAHQPNEFLAVEQVTSMAEILKTLISAYCVKES